MKKMNKKGNMSIWQTILFGIAIGLITIGVLAILLQAMRASSSITCSSGYIYNASSDSCHEAANVSATSPTTVAGNITQDGLVFLDNTTSQFGTAGTVLGVALLLVIIAALGIGGYMAYKKYR